MHYLRLESLRIFHDSVRIFTHSDRMAVQQDSRQYFYVFTVARGFTVLWLADWSTDTQKRCGLLTTPIQSQLSCSRGSQETAVASKVHVLSYICIADASSSRPWHADRQLPWRQGLTTALVTPVKVRIQVVLQAHHLSRSETGLHLAFLRCILPYAACIGHQDED